MGTYPERPDANLRAAGIDPDVTDDRRSVEPEPFPGLFDEVQRHLVDTHPFDVPEGLVRLQRRLPQLRSDGSSATEEVPAGQNLRQCGAGRRAFDVGAVAQIVHQVAVGLAELHDRGRVHGAVMPETIVIRSTDPWDVALATDLIPWMDTREHDTAAAAHYMPPEDFPKGSSPLRAAGDYWALGVIAFELTTGQRPFVSHSDIEDLFRGRALVSAEAVSDPHLRRLCAGLLALDPLQRWTSVEVGQWLDGASPALPDMHPLQVESVRAAVSAGQRPAMPTVRLSDVGQNKLIAAGTACRWDAKDHFDEGLRALKARLYPKAVQQFEESVTTATQAGLGEDPNARDLLAAAHFHAALAMLGGRNPGDRGPEDIERMERHLEQVLGCHEEVVSHQAKVLWAIVKEDYYEAYGMPATMPDPAVFRLSVEQLTAADLEPLVTHISRATGKTWETLCQRAVAHGLMAEPVATAPVARTRDPHRSEAVKKYFTPTPEHRSNSGFIAAFASAGMLILIAIAIHNFGTLLILSGAGWLAKWGFEESRRYREYLRKFRLAEPKPSDQQMDTWLQEDISEISQRVGGRVRLNTELKAHGGDLVYPIQVIEGYPSKEKTAGYRVRARRGTDHKLRANAYDVLFMLLTDNLISTYRCVLDCHTGDVVVDEITEHHYRDIVGVTSTSIPMPESLAKLVAEIDEKHREIPLAQTFSLSISNGESLSVATGFSRPEDGSTDDIAWGSNARALDVVKKMIRARHMA